jgi:hypothetical protein
VGREGKGERKVAPYVMRKKKKERKKICTNEAPFRERKRSVLVRETTPNVVVGAAAAAVVTTTVAAEIATLKRVVVAGGTAAGCRPVPRGGGVLPTVRHGRPWRFGAAVAMLIEFGLAARGQKLFKQGARNGHKILVYSRNGR